MDDTNNVAELVANCLESHTRLCILNAFDPTYQRRNRRHQLSLLLGGNYQAFTVTDIFLKDLRDLSVALCDCKRPHKHLPHKGGRRDNADQEYYDPPYGWGVTGTVRR